MTQSISSPRAPFIRSSSAAASTVAEVERQAVVRPASADEALPAADQLPELTATTTASTTDRGWSQVSYLKWAAWGTLALVLLAAGWQLATVLSAMMASHWLLASFTALLLTAVLVCLALGAWRELKLLRYLRAATALREQGEALAAGDSALGSQHYVAAIRQLYRDRDDESLQAAWRDADTALQQPLSDREVVEQLSLWVGQPLDQQAQRIIARYVRRLAVITALNPIAVLDSAIVMWLGLKMVREIAVVYGAKPGVISTWHLLKQVVVLMTVTAAGDLVADASVDLAGVGVAGAVSARLGQGVVTGLFVARLGLYTLTQCRPIPLAEHRQALWKSLRAEVFSVFNKR